MKIFTPRGFTLIELLVVIALIGILSAVVLASLNSARLKSRDTRRIADLKQIQLALQLYYDANSTYPGTPADLVPTYIAAIPADPTGGAYRYDLLSAGASYHLAASLEDEDNQAKYGDLDTVTDTINGGDSGDCGGGSSRPVCYDIGP